MSNDSLGTTVANKLDEIIHTENFQQKYRVYSTRVGYYLHDIQSKETIFGVDGYANHFKVILPKMGDTLHFYNNIWAEKRDHDKNTLLFEEPSDCEKVENAFWFLHSTIYPNTSEAWRLKTPIQIRRIYNLWRNSDLNKEEDQYRIIETMATLATSEHFQYTYNFKPWRLSEGLCQVYYKDYLCFRIGIYCANTFDSLFYNAAGIGIDLGHGTPMFLPKNSPGTWWFGSPYNSANKLYDYLAHLSPRDR